MNKRYRLAEIEEAVSEMEELIDIEDDIAEINDDFQIVVSGRCLHGHCRRKRMDKTMKFISWNVNGLRACMQKGFLDFFQ